MRAQLMAMTLAAAIAASGCSTPAPAARAVSPAPNASSFLASTVSDSGVVSLLASSPDAATHIAGSAQGTPVETLAAWGLFDEGWPPGNTQVAELNAALGQTPSVISWYVQAAATYPPGTLSGQRWADNVERVRAVHGSGQIPLITWEMSGPSGGNPMPLTQIIGGGFDTYFDSWAAGVKTVAPGLVYLRPFHEMNLVAQYPWSVHASNRFGNKPAQIGDAWRHVVDRFRAAGVTNVRWVFNPGGDLTNNPLAPESYPGDSYVDFIGADLYSGTPPNSAALDEAILVRLANKPWLHGEVGGTATWVRDELAPLMKRRPMTAVWFDADPSPLYGQPEVIAAVRDMLAGLAPGGSTGGTPGGSTSGAIPANGGFGLFVFEGGSVQQLTAKTGCPTASMALWATVNGNFVTYVPGTSIGAVNAAFLAAFPGGTIPPNTPFVGKCR